MSCIEDVYEGVNQKVAVEGVSQCETAALRADEKLEKQKKKNLKKSKKKVV
jgi:hypothetical protein